MSVFAHSVEKQPIFFYEFGRAFPNKNVLILAGVHGDEIEGVTAAYGLLSRFLENYAFRFRITLIPMFNIDGVLKKMRTNANGVDLNRNLPTKDWTSHVANPRYNPGVKALSEPENIALVSFLEKEKPCFILSLHSWHPTINVNGNCLAEAKAISAMTNYKIETDIGYPTPGCLGTYAGIERNFPVLTYEIERGLNTEAILSIHVPAILEALKITDEK